MRSGIGFLDFLSGLWPIAAAGLIVDVLLLTALYRRSITGTPPTPATCLLRLVLVGVALTFVMDRSG